MKDILKQLEGKTIGINYRNAGRLENAMLVSVGDDFITVKGEEDVNYYFPTRAVMKIIKGEKEVTIIPGLFQRQKFSAVVLVEHFIVYSGYVGVSVGG